MSDVVFADADKEDRDFDGVLTAAETDGSSFQREFRELKSDGRAVRVEVAAGLVDVVQIAKCSFKLE